MGACAKAALAPHAAATAHRRPLTEPRYVVVCCQARLKRAEARETGAFKKHTKLQADITAIEVRTATPARPQHSAAPCVWSCRARLLRGGCWRLLLLAVVCCSHAPRCGPKVCVPLPKLVLRLLRLIMLSL